MAQFVQGNAGGIEPEPDHQSSFAAQLIADGIDALAQCLACGAQEDEQDSDGGDDEPWLIGGELRCL